MKIATWNVNSIKARLEHVKSWISKNAPDVLLLQELKTLDFPAEEFKALGYETAAVTQKTYNGVAILSRENITVEREALPGDDTDEQARYLEVTINGLRLIDIYLPNGNPVDSEKFPYKLAWMERLKTHLETLRAQSIPFLVGGDFNVIPEAQDCYNPALWSGDALFHPETLKRFRALLNLGLTDALRVQNTAPEQYTYWDYQDGAWPKNNGIRIDHFLLSPVLADRLQSCTIDPSPRGEEKPSDHVPVVVEIS